MGDLSKELSQETQVENNSTQSQNADLKVSGD